MKDERWGVVVILAVWITALVFNIGALALSVYIVVLVLRAMGVI